MLQGCIWPQNGQDCSPVCEHGRLPAHIGDRSVCSAAEQGHGDAPFTQSWAATIKPLFGRDLLLQLTGRIHASLSTVTYLRLSVFKVWMPHINTQIKKYLKMYWARNVAYPFFPPRALAWWWFLSMTYASVRTKLFAHGSSQTLAMCSTFLSHAKLPNAFR